ncbi:hypothetical protein LG3211_0473 [Lysobacter gummosus]|nr:hypothetical protein LG3211_0473 [Lysobacter gummosus]
MTGSGAKEAQAVSTDSSAADNKHLQDMIRISRVDGSRR